MNVYVLISSFDAQFNATVYAEDNLAQAQADFLNLFTKELENSVSPENAVEFKFDEDFNNDMFFGEYIYYSPNVAFSFIDSGYDVTLELCPVN